jgi:hypothetical protein
MRYVFKSDGDIKCLLVDHFIIYHLLLVNIVHYKIYSTQNAIIHNKFHFHVTTGSESFTKVLPNGHLNIIYSINSLEYIGIVVK